LHVIDALGLTRRRILAARLFPNQQTVDNSTMAKPTQAAASGSTDAVVRHLPVATAPRGAADPSVFLADANARAAVIGAAPPFAAWPWPALLGLAQAARAVPYAAGALLFRHGEQIGRVAVVWRRAMSRPASWLPTAAA
jgi:hypothetical protein